MRAPDGMQETMLSFTSLEQLVPGDHPPRRVRKLVDEALIGLDDLFNQIHAETGRASIAPEKLRVASSLLENARCN